MSNTKRILIKKEKVSFSSPPLVIGRGAMGEVFLAKYQGKEVVIKKSQRDDVDVALKEYNNYSKLQKHENILKFYGVLRDGRHSFCLVLEYAPNGNLSSYLKTHTVNWDWKAKVCRDIALGLMHCHENNVLHFDLKPENVLLNIDCVPKLADFGVSKTKSQMVLDNNKAGGTLNYVAPERVCRDEKMRGFFERFPKLSDVYSYGLILWSVANDGEHPYDGLDDDEIKDAKRSFQSSIHLMKQLPKDAPEVYNQLVYELINFNPQARAELSTARLELEFLFEDEEGDNQNINENNGNLGIGDISEDESDNPSPPATDPDISGTSQVASSTTIGSSNKSEIEFDYTQEEVVKLVSSPKMIFIEDKTLPPEKTVPPNIKLPEPVLIPHMASPSSTSSDHKSQTTLLNSPMSPRTEFLNEEKLIEDVLNVFIDWEKATDSIMEQRLYLLAQDKEIRPSNILTVFMSEKRPSADIYFALGFMNEHGFGKTKDLNLAFVNYGKAANLGDVRSEIYLGWCYYKGTGIPKDPQKAFDWFKSAANKGCVSALNNVGWCYDIGFGTSTDPGKAFEYFKESAEKGYATAQCRVAVCYEYGRGTVKDLQQAIDWYTKAADNGHEIARKRVTELTSFIPHQRNSHRRSFIRGFERIFYGPSRASTTP
ncbi:hypothetical protein G9A89_006645 [Geosiphon pyriformis]|nr:hypothetical protein G9A89_006645 [Geosiphon pyriformis]